jgi:hypothetical protein
LLELRHVIKSISMPKQAELTGISQKMPAEINPKSNQHSIFEKGVLSVPKECAPEFPSNPRARGLNRRVLRTVVPRHRVSAVTSSSHFPRIPTGRIRRCNTIFSGSNLHSKSIGGCSSLVALHHPVVFARNLLEQRSGVKSKQGNGFKLDTQAAAYLRVGHPP